MPIVAPAFSTAPSPTTVRRSELNPDYAAVYNERGVAYSRKGLYDRAVADFGRAIDRMTNPAAAYYNRANAYRRQGSYDEAIADYGRAISFRSGFARAYNNHGNVYRHKRQYDRAIADYDRAIGLKPDYALAYKNRGDVYRRKGMFDLAVADYDAALRLSPEYSGAYGSKAWLRATARDAKFRDGEEAVRLARRATALRDNAVNHGILATALAEAGDFAAAVTEQERALAMAHSEGRKDVTDFEGRLALYRAGKPCRKE